MIHRGRGYQGRPSAGPSAQGWSRLPLPRRFLISETTLYCTGLASRGAKRASIRHVATEEKVGLALKVHLAQARGALSIEVESMHATRSSDVTLMPGHGEFFKFGAEKAGVTKEGLLRDPVLEGGRIPLEHRSRKATMGRELMALRSDRTTRIPPGVASPVTTNHAGVGFGVWDSPRQLRTRPRPQPALPLPLPKLFTVFASASRSKEGSKNLNAGSIKGMWRAEGG